MGNRRVARGSDAHGRPHRLGSRSDQETRARSGNATNEGSRMPRELVNSHHDQWLVGRNTPAFTEALRALASVPEGAGPARELVSRLLTRGYSNFADTLTDPSG